MFFFFKQKTAYEMRISDWSSDVCSSDLEQQRHALHRQPDLDGYHRRLRHQGLRLRRRRRYRRRHDQCRDQVGYQRVPRLGVLRLQECQRPGRQPRRGRLRPVRHRQDHGRHLRRPDREGQAVLLRLVRRAGDPDFGGASQSDGVSNGFVTSQEVQDAMDIAAGLGMQPGNYGSTGVNLENKRTLVKLDWNISDYHRASLTYQETKEFRPSPYDAFPENVVLSIHWYKIGRAHVGTHPPTLN